MAFCSECGSDIGSAKFCGECGTPTVNAPTTKSPVKSTKKEVKKPAKETDIAEFTDGVGCNVRLTTEKIYAKSVGLEETYALRSVDGAGVFDDMELFAKEKLAAESGAKTKKVLGIIFAIIGGAGMLMALANGVFDPIFVYIIFLVIGIVMINASKNAVEKVKLKSYIKIIISGSNKLYLFDKNASDSEKVAEFLEKVEETLTKYN